MREYISGKPLSKDVAHGDLTEKPGESTKEEAVDLGTLGSTEAAVPKNSDSHSGEATDGHLKHLWKWCTGSPLRRTLSTLGALLLAAVSGGTGAAVAGILSTPMARPVDATQHIIFSPWNSSGHLVSTVHIYARVKGYCWSNSSISLRPDAFRCFGPNGEIFDPCFEAPGEYRAAGQVVCPNPSPENVTVIYLSKKLPPGASSNGPLSEAASTVWLIVLRNGDECYAVNAEAYSPGGMQLTYQCPHIDSYGRIDTIGRVWKIWQQADGAPTMNLAPIEKAYS